MKGDSQRPLVNGVVTSRQLLAYGLLASFASLTIVFITNSSIIIMLFASMLLLNIAYSFRPIQISHKGGLAPLLLPLGYVVLTVNSGILITGLAYTIQTWLLVIAMYIHFLSRILLKDHRDIRGDSSAGKQTLVIKYGNQRVVFLALTLFGVSTAMLGITAYQTVPKALPFMASCAGGAILSLRQLLKEERWQFQKPLITIYGRFCSGMITLLIVGLLPGIIHLSNYQFSFVLILITSIFFVSIFDIIKLQHPFRNTKI